MNLILNISNLSSEDYHFLICRIKLIRDKIFPNLEINTSSNEKKINIFQEIEDMEKAVLLFKLFNNLNSKKENSKPIHFECKIENIIDGRVK